jgi:hypothetical protein
MTSGVRRFLLGVLTLGVTGLGLELLLIGHFDDPFQFVPLVLLGSGLPTLSALAARPRPAIVRVVQGLMILFVMSGGAGVMLHSRGNAAFELEMYPTLAGWDLVRGTLTGATPVLAPGSMTLLGLVGLAVAYRYPAVDRPTEEARS